MLAILIRLLPLIALSGCSYSGYSPSYIISDAAEETEEVPSFDPAAAPDL